MRGWGLLARRGAETVAALMFAAVFVIFVYKLAMRYLAHDAVAWADELCVVLFIWIIFWTNGLLLEDARQIRFDLLVRRLSPGGQRIAAIARLALIGGVFAWAFPGIVDYTLFLWRERTPVLLMRLDVVYSCFALFAAAIVIANAAHILRLARSGWRDNI